MYSNKKYERIGSLDCLVNNTGKGDYTVVLFHGFGADASDLYPLSDHLSLDGIGRWIFPNGCMAANGVPFGRAWFPIDLEAYEHAMRTGDFRDFSTFPDGIESAFDKALALIDHAGLVPEKTIIGGFSQGAMLSAHLMLKSSLNFAGLVLLSGTYLGQKEWQEMAGKKKAPFIQSHGKSDPILPFNNAEKLYSILREKQWNGKFISFEGGHEIPPNVLGEVMQFLNGLVSN